MVCHQCQVEIVTFVQHEMNPFFPIVGFTILFVFGYISLLLCPLIYLITQNAVHRCSRCLHILGVKRCFGIPDDLSSPVSKLISSLTHIFLKIWHIKLGKCAIVMEKLYAIILIVIISTVSIVYVYNKPYTIHHSFFERPMEDS